MRSISVLKKKEHIVSFPNVDLYIFNRDTDSKSTVEGLLFALSDICLQNPAVRNFMFIVKDNVDTFNIAITSTNTNDSISFTRENIVNSVYPIYNMSHPTVEDIVRVIGKISDDADRTMTINSVGSRLDCLYINHAQKFVCIGNAAAMMDSTRKAIKASRNVSKAIDLDKARFVRIRFLKHHNVSNNDSSTHDYEYGIGYLTADRVNKSTVAKYLEKYYVYFDANRGRLIKHNYDNRIMYDEIFLLDTRYCDSDVMDDLCCDPKR